MPRKPSKKTLGKKLDATWSKLIRSKGKCEVCGKRDSLNAHHIVGRRNRTLRWEPYNGVCLCAGCHTFKKDSAHQNPLWFNSWLEENRWEDLKECYLHMNDIKKWTVEDMQDKLKELEDELA